MGMEDSYAKTSSGACPRCGYGGIGYQGQRDSGFGNYPGLNFAYSGAGAMPERYKPSYARSASSGGGKYSK